MARKNAKLRGDHHFECGDPGDMNGPNFILNRLEKGLANSREALEVAWRINTGIIILGILMSAVGISSWYRRIRNIRGEEFAKEVKDRKAAYF